MINYKLARSVKINGQSEAVFKLYDNVELYVPFDEGNTDYQVYLKWLEEGNTPLPADEPNEGTV
jgi:hypothetical protein